MKLYGIIFLISFSLIIGLNVAFNTSTNSEILLMLLISIFISFLIDAVVAFIIHKLPRKYFNPYSKFFKVFSFERKFYEFIQIRKWKDLVPETGQLCNFKKNKIYKPNDALYLYKFMEETCYAELMHFLCSILSYGILLLGFINLKLMITICLPIAIINSITQLLPALIQRYLRPRLKLMYNRVTRNNKQTN